MAKFEAFYGKIETRPAFKAGRWWTNDENMNWVADYDDVGVDGIAGTHDPGEGDGKPTAGEPDFDQTDKDESDQIGLTGFKMNRIKGPSKADPVDDIVFFGTWPPLLYEKFTDPAPGARFDSAVVLNYNIGFLFASGPFKLPAGQRERFSLALAYGSDLIELRTQVRTVQQIYNANYQFAVPPPMPVVRSESGDKSVRLSWTDVSERGIDPVTHENDFEGYKVYRATDPEFQDPKVISNARGTGTFGNGKPIAQFDLKNGIRGFSNQIVEGTAYDLGTDSGLMHTWVDTTVKNGQDYYYAVCAYDHGSDSLGFYPSENSIAVSRTPRGGTILPPNVVEIRPEPSVLGFVRAQTSNLRHAAGSGRGSVVMNIVDSKQVPDNTTYLLRFYTNAPQHIHAARYELFDSVAQKAVFSNGSDFRGEGRGPVGVGILPVVTTPDSTVVDTSRSGFVAGKRTNAALTISNVDHDSSDVRRPGYPNDFTITFSDRYLDTSTISIYGDPTPVKFKIEAQTTSGTSRMKFYWAPSTNNTDSTLSKPEDRLIIVTQIPGRPYPTETWLIQLDTVGQSVRGTLIAPGLGDTYQAILGIPFSADDIFAFSTRGQSVDAGLARQQYGTGPYVVPNPYAGAASFEPERFAVTGRGERRMEFRGLPARAVIRIYTVRGELVQTLHHDGGTDGFVPWNLRTKDNLDVAPGLYIYHVEAEGFDSHIGKFAIIK